MQNKHIHKNFFSLLADILCSSLLYLGLQNSPWEFLKLCMRIKIDTGFQSSISLCIQDILIRLTLTSCSLQRKRGSFINLYCDVTRFILKCHNLRCLGPWKMTRAPDPLCRDVLNRDLVCETIREDSEIRVLTSAPPRTEV